MGADHFRPARETAGVLTRASDFDRAPSHARKANVPTNAEMAAMLRGGESIEDLAARLRLSVAGIRTRLNDAGWHGNGQPNHTVYRPRAVDAARDSRTWTDRALCAQTDPEAFFPEKGGSTNAAKRVCGSCEVRTECLEDALLRDERHGVFGGLSERERRRLRKAAS